MRKKIPKWKKYLNEITFEYSTPAAKIFDGVLLFLIISSITIVMLDSVPSLHLKHKIFFHKLEWAFTVLFTIEYVLRIISAKQPGKFAFSFLGIVDFIAIIPTYLTLLIYTPDILLILRVLRLLRIFRIFRLSHFLKDVNFLAATLYKSIQKITIFMIFAMVLVILLGSLMYLVEKPENGFTSIPECVYWALVTLTTVGYGDVVPVTILGKAVASIVMLTGFVIIAVPLGIVTNEMAKAMRSRDAHTGICKACKMDGHDADANYCKFCGEKFNAINKKV
ncbi:MAG: ion transporter [Ginsengibacter sp.]